MSNELLRLEIHGEKALLAALKQLPDKVQRKVLRPAIRSGTKILRDETKRRVPKVTRALEKSLRVRVMAKLRKGSIGFVVEAPTLIRTKTKAGKMVLKAKKRKDTPLRGQSKWYAGFVEGTHQVPGMKTTPFMRPARDATENIVRGVARRELDALVAAETAKINR